MSAVAHQQLTPRIYLRGQIDYASIDAVNFSTMKYMAKSPRHYRYACENPSATTQPMRLGDASHTATLEPMRFTRDYAVYEPPEGKTDRRGTKAWDEFLEANPGRTVLKQDEFDNAMRIRDAVRSSTEAMRDLRTKRRASGASAASTSTRAPLQTRTSSLSSRRRATSSHARSSPPTRA